MTSPRYQTYLGDDALASLAANLADRGSKRILLVTGKASFEQSGASNIVPMLEEFATVVRWCDFSPNTDAADLEVGLRAMQQAQCDAVVGIGGGSVMDMAKLLCAYQHVTTAEELHNEIRSGRSIESRLDTLGLAPTTSGSGSEATHFAVVYIGEAKYSVAGPALYADVVALDPQLALSGSAHQRATSGLDAVSQAIESRWAANATPRSRRYAEFALCLLLNHLEVFVNDPTPESARSVQLGSHLAGRAIDISKTTAAHALSYGITKRYGVNHGHAVALTLGEFIEDHASSGARLQPAVSPDDHDAAMTFILDSLDATDGPTARAQFISLIERLALPSSLTDVGCLTLDELQTLASTVNAERLGNNPVVYDSASLIDILRRASRLH